eukprot:365808-Chlamydomonas_euryale.AAC.32
MGRSSTATPAGGSSYTVLEPARHAQDCSQTGTVVPSSGSVCVLGGGGNAWPFATARVRERSIAGHSRPNSIGQILVGSSRRHNWKDTSAT